jgi:hypothetical protein
MLMCMASALLLVNLPVVSIPVLAEVEPDCLMKTDSEVG